MKYMASPRPVISILYSPAPRPTESHCKWHDVMDSPDHLRSSQYTSNPTSVMVQGVAALSQNLLALGQDGGLPAHIREATNHLLIAAHKAV